MPAAPVRPLGWADSPQVAALLTEIELASRDDVEVLPARFFARLRAAGFGRLRIPVEEGGLGGSVRDLLDAFVALAAADSNVAQSWRTHVLATERHVHDPAGPRRDRWLTRIAAGAIIGGGWTEADGSGATTITTRLSSVDGRLVLSGRKFYSTGSRYADWLEFSAVDDAGAPVIVAVPAGAAGVEVRDDWSGFGQRATGSGTTILDDVEVDPADVAPFGTQPLGIAGWQQLTLLAVLVGIGEAVRSAAGDVVRTLDRLTGAAPVAALEEYGRISALIAAARASLRAAGEATQAASEAIVSGDADAGAAADRAERATFAAQATLVAQVVEAADRLVSLPDLADDPAEADRLRRTRRLDRFWRNAQTIATHNAVLHRLRAIADAELYGLARVSEPLGWTSARAERVAVAARETQLAVVRVPPSLSAELATDRERLDRLAHAFGDRAPVLFQFDDAGVEHFDGGVAAAVWLRRFPRAWFAVTTSSVSSAGHPYNLARRIASLEQLSAGRLAWVWESPDRSDAARDYVRVVQQLWRSWPRESIAADAAAEAFAETASIRRIHADGTYPVAGPLNVPSSPQYLPVFVAPDGTADPFGYVDLAARDGAWVLAGARPGALPLAREERPAGLDDLLRLATELPPADGSPAQTLRARLGLAAPVLAELPGAEPRFTTAAAEAS